MKYILITIFISFTLQSCVIYNTTKGEESNVCHVHDKKMKKAVVVTKFGRGYFKGNTREYPNAKSKLGMGCIRPTWPVKRLAVIYHCEVCNDLKRKHEH